jgi:proteic killer suppression protein
MLTLCPAHFLREYYRQIIVDTRQLTAYNLKMIKSFKHRGLKRFFSDGNPQRLPRDMLERISLILARLNTAKTIEAMDIHSYNLHELKGNRKGTWSVTVRANWRITFQFENGDAIDVNFEDYH